MEGNIFIINIIEIKCYLSFRYYNYIYLYPKDIIYNSL